MADGEIRINTKIDLKDFQKLNNEVVRLEKKFETLKRKGDINRSLGVKETSAQMRRLDLETQNVYNDLTKARDAFNSYKDTHGLSNLSTEEAQAKLKELNKVQESVFSKMSRNIKESGSLFGSIGKRIWGLAKRVFVFSLITKAFRAMVSGMKDGFKNLALVSDEYNRNMSAFKSQTEQLKNSMASAFAPIVNSIIPNLTRLVEWLNIAMDKVAQFFAVLSGKSTYMKAKAQMVDYRKEIQATAKEANKLASFDDINVLDQDTGSGSGATDAFEETQIDETKFKWVEWLKDNLDAIKELVIAIGIGLLAWKLSSAFLGALSPVAISIGLIAVGVASLVIAFKRIQEEGEITGQTFGLLTVGIMAIAGAIALLTGSWIPLLIGAIASIVVGIYAFGDEINAWLDSTWDKLTGFFDKLKEKNEYLFGILAKPLNKFLDSIQTKLLLVKSGVQMFVTQVQGLVKGLVNIVKGIMTGDWELVWLGAKQIFFGFVKGIAQMFENMVNRIIDGINAMGFDMPDWLGGKSWHPSISHISISDKIPQLATGGITNRPTTALIGEAGREAVLPLENNTEWMDTLASKISGSNQIVINFEGDLASLARILNPVLTKESQRIGHSLVIS